ncbi:MAG: two-component hybrid sensor and regulator, partial [Myxococcaceae bacterium]|nr:two-component hybrid sensor and regulator [Myxococcaceae bacterium]
MKSVSDSPRHALSGGGEMGALMRSIDWTKTSVGAPESWPQSLRTALSILLETGFPMYIAWGPEFTQFYNDGYRPILGSTKHPVAMGLGTRRTFAEIWHIIGPMFEGVMEGRSFSLTDFLLPLDRHGFVEECYFVFSYSPIREEAGNVGGVLVTVFETTDRVLGARRLATLQDLAASSQHAPTAAAACEIAASVLAQNSADMPFALIYGLDGSDQEPLLAGRAWPAREGLLASADRSEPAALAASSWPIAEVCSTRQPKLVEFDSHVLGGLTASAESPLPSRAIVHPIFVSGSEQPRAVLVTALSPRLPFDAHYRSFFSLVAGHIGSAIASATALEEAKARASALAEIDRAKTAFFSNVSHEFRTPLTLLLGPTEDALAAPADLSSEQHERWSIVHRNALRLSKLVNTLLDFSRIEAGRIRATYEAVDLAALTAELTSMFRSAIERVGLGLRLELSTGAELGYVDREMWEKIVLNLLSNALKFTFEGEIAVALNLVGDYFELTVRDTGIGIPSEQLPFVFDRFHRVAGALSRTHEGTGIGLALVAELAKLLGGDVRVESAEGHGTCFSVRVRRGDAHLPRERIISPAVAPLRATRAAEPYVAEALRWSAESPAQTSDSAASLTSEATTEGRARIVLADDNADMREYLARLLQERWDVEAVGDGAAALTAIRREPADLVLMDVMMPGLDGFGFLRALRADPQLRLTPVILLSARAGEEATAEALSSGADDYMVKPFSARELLVRIAAKLAVARVAREARAIEDAQRESLYRHFMQAPFPIAVMKGPQHLLELANPPTLRTWGK